MTNHTILDTDSKHWRLLTVKMELADVRLTDTEREQLRSERDRLQRELQRTSHNNVA